MNDSTGRFRTDRTPRRRDVQVVRTIPDNGDVVCVQQTRGGQEVHVLHAAPGPDQILFRSRERTLAAARTDAGRERVRAWAVGDGGALTLLADYRGIGPARRARK